MNTSRRDFLRFFAMSAAMAAFIVNDAFVKLAARTLPIAQLIFLRSLLVMAIMFIAVRASEKISFSCARKSSASD